MNCVEEKILCDLPLCQKVIPDLICNTNRNKFTLNHVDRNKAT